MTVFVLLRHGVTAWNCEGRIQGRTDIPLSDKGNTKLTVRTVPDECRGFRTLASPLARCTETAMALGLKDIVHDDRLVEMCWGAWEGRLLKELRTELGGEMLLNEERGLDFTPPGGESPRGVLRRISSLLAEVAAEGRPTLAVTHKGVIRAIFAAASSWDMRGRPPFRLDWDALHLFHLDAAGAPGLLRMNVPLEPRALRESLS